jgi:hypothetical protein
MTNVLNYSDVVEQLEVAVNREQIGAHHAFWRGLTRDQFVEKRVYGLQLVELGNGNQSNLILALRGSAPFGEDAGTPDATMPRMPANRPPMAAENIIKISNWIDGGCPE